ncbi:uncharacterized protein TNCV_3689201 [Trichonephila clavipes]|uniref:Transposase n=1 Tax=Trichonephila clavipes TaxID=2585209 RepID=A0A8X6SN75_TRICX|nr:uncharacterized protein TNCV_3689201 [Trichonephila clavipes]
MVDFHKRIFFSDEAHFWLNGYDNKQNCRIWSEDNSQVYVETPLHPEKLTVWCALWAEVGDGNGRIGPLVSGNIDKLFEEARQKTKIQQNRWVKYHNQRRREVTVKGSRKPLYRQC